MKLPLKITIDFVERVDDTWFYEFVISVPGDATFETVLRMRTSLDGDASVHGVKQCGLERLDDGVRDRFLIRLFMLGYHEMMSQDGSGMQWIFSDVSAFIEAQLACIDAAEVKFALGSLATPNLEVTDIAIVRID